MTEIVLTGHKVAKGSAEGEALVTQDAIAFFGGVNAENGVVVERGHQLEGICVSDKILLFPQEKGSAGSSFQLYEMRILETQPAAIINVKAGSTVAVGAIVSNIPMMDRVEPDPYQNIETGDWVRLDADRGTITVVKRKPENGTPAPVTPQEVVQS